MHVCLISDTTIRTLEGPLAKALEPLVGPVRFTHCEYAVHELLNPAAAPYTSEPELVLLALHADQLAPELFRTSTLLGPVEARRTLIEGAVEAVVGHVRRLLAGTRAPVLVCDLVVPLRSPLGIQDNAVELGLLASIRRINAGLEEALRPLPRASVVTLSALAAGLAAPTESPKLRYLAGQRESRPLLGALAGEVARHVHARRGLTRKVLVLDLDNTLWGGVLGEEGTGGIDLDVAGTGRAYRDLQQACLDLRDRGVLLALASKNDAEPALHALASHPHALLRPEHFSAVQIHWEDKATSCRRIAEALNVGLDSLVFFDDNPVERAWVATACPQVEVVEVPPDPARYRQVLLGLRAFETASLTAEDARRSDLYRQESDRRQALVDAGEHEAFLAGLDTRLTVGALDAETAGRIAQLVRKTNQLNLTTVRRSQAELEALAASDDHVVLWASVRDRIGDAGGVGVAIVARGRRWRLDTFLLSCRVLQRGIEAAFLRCVAELAAADEATGLVANWIRTAKNGPSQGLLPACGFTVVSQSEAALQCELDLTEPLPEAPFVQRVLLPSTRRGAA